MFRAHFKMGRYNLLQISAVWLVLCGCVIYLVYQPSLQTSQLITIIGYVLQLTAPFGMLAYALMNLKGQFVALNTGLQYISNTEQYEHLNASHPDDARSASDALYHAQALQLPIHEHNNPLYFQIFNQQITLIQAPSGFGKTTLIHTLMGLNRDYQGDVWWQNQQLSECSSTTLFNHLAYVPQHPVIIDGSLRDNLLWGESTQNTTTNELFAALHALGLAHLCAHTDIEQLDSPDFSQRELSGGERQRLSIARAVLRHKPVIILDEPTAALDEAMGHKVIQYLRAHTTTLIIISHQDWLQQYADQTIVL